MAFLLQLLYLCFVGFDVYYECVSLVSPYLLFQWMWLSLLMAMF